MECLWRDLVDSILLQILELLPYSSILSAGQVCKRWHRLSLDDILWKVVLTKHFNLTSPVTLREGAVSWKEEFVRMMDTVPCVESEKLEFHSDEVVHVSYANTKQMFSACSKDGKTSVWRADHPCTLLAVLEGVWETPFTSKFNFSDSLIMVNGMTDEQEGVIAIFRVGVGEGDSFSLLTVISNSMYDKIDNGWVSDTTFLSTLEDIGKEKIILNGIIDIDSENEKWNREVEIKKLYDIDEDFYCRCISTVKTRGDPSLLFSCGNLSMQDQRWVMAPTRMGFVQKHDDVKVNFEDSDFKLFTPSSPDNPHMYISGYCLDPEEKICYLNVRPLTPTPENSFGAFDANENFQLLPLSMSTMSSGPPLLGHKGYQIEAADPFSLNCIYPDVTRDYVGCGSEDNKGYLWDRNFGCLVAVVEGHTKPVCGVALDKVNQDVMVTAGDDHQIRVFRTRKWKRQNVLYKCFRFM